MATSGSFDILFKRPHADTNEYACDETARAFKRKPCRVRHPFDARARNLFFGVGFVVARSFSGRKVLEVGFPLTAFKGFNTCWRTLRQLNIKVG